MTLTKLAFRNIKRNLKNYMVYFVSMIFSILIYYTFTSLEYNSQIKAASDASKKIASAFQFSSVLLILFVAVFIIYSNGFFTRKRKKEVGLYSLLGLRKKQIGKMLFYENLAMGIVSLIIGILLGALLSEVFLVLLLKLMHLNLHVRFEVPLAAILNTAIVFLIIILYTSFQGYRLIYRFKLIELFHADKKGEAVPKGSIALALLSILLIAVGYYLASTFFHALDYIPSQMLPFLIIGVTVLGTYLLFRCFSVALLKFTKKRKRTFYNGMNMISTSQLLYHIKGNATTLASIAVLGAVTLCAIGTTATLYYHTYTDTAHQYPYSLSYVKDGKWDQKIDGILKSHQKNHPITLKSDLPMVKVKAKFDMPYVPNYHFMEDDGLYLISASAFNHIAKQKGEALVNVRQNQTYIVDGMYQNSPYQESYENHHVSIHIGQEKKAMDIKGIIDDPLTDLNELIMVVPDKLYDQAKNTGQVRTVENINYKNQADSEAISKSVLAAIPNNRQVADYYSAFNDMVQTTGIMIFIGTFLGLVFLMATGSIIYFKQLTEAFTDKGNYAILRKIGVTHKEMKKSIAGQMGIVFLAPLAVAVLHSAFALNTMSTLLQMTIAVPVMISMVLYMIIYFVYYVMTIRSYYKIVTT
ncbi:FtsX-like permease family protein [Camelliibacillus cellulosilyticus]|uniref:FtsX-like permease family protein n=1 Tax=Camelliibacillus cellulosilyticus TaxID=2174486 RepID=A0ABV9GNK1_9BACL